MIPLRLTVAANGRQLLAWGAPVALCADTTWGIFADTTQGEWSTYLALRRMQGFNAALISVLPILHDRSLKLSSRQPFAVRSDGSYDFDRVDDAYFVAGRALAEQAAQAGVVPMLVLLWCNYVPGTWGAGRTPWAVMSREQRTRYLNYVVPMFADLEPIFIISGDDHLRDAEPVAVYGEALDQVKRLAPDCLTTLHSTPETTLPRVLAEAPALDFYIYQSGHYAQRQALCHEIPARYDNLPVRPLMNAEPCYEAHGFGDTGEGRFSAQDIRRAVWWSLLSGASAGIGYGAHGVWQWQRPGEMFNNPSFSMEPLPWLAALQLPGAWDTGFARLAIEDHGLVGAVPRQEALLAPARGVRVAAGDRALAVYMPFTQTLRLDVPRGVRITAWDLAAQRRVVVAARAEAGALVIDQPAVAGDMLLFLEEN